MVKNTLQKILRLINISLFKTDLPNNISIYFHETGLKEINDIEKIILFFKEREYIFLTIDEFNKRIDNNHKTVAFTFDDGFSNWINTIPIFNKYDVKATYYLNSIQFTSEPKEKFLSDIKCNDKNLLITIDQLEAIKVNGHEIGAHTHSHKTLNNIDEEDFKYEVSENLKILKLNNIEPKNFAVPFGMRRYIKNHQLDYLRGIFDSVAFGEPGMLYDQKEGLIQRYPWKIEKSFKYNINNISTNTSLFNNFTKRSGLG
tara:strand:- start:160 stop:933 length:774 start_codon:yes stop_codon:yes gene_type:complete